MQNLLRGGRGFFGVLAPFAAGAAVALLVAAGLTDRLDLPIRDAVLAFLHAERASAVLVVAIDDRALRARGPWPWPRAQLAQLVATIAGDDRVSVVVLDTLLIDERPGDEALAAALARKRSVLAAALENGAWLMPATRLREVAPAAHASLDLDYDGVLRRLSSTKQNARVSLPALSVAGAQAAGSLPAIPIGRMIVPSFRSVPDIRSAEEVLSSGLALRGNGRVIVFIGVTAAGLGDRVVIPTAARGDLTPGVVVHAMITQDLIDGRMIRVAPPIVAGMLAVALILACARVARMGGTARVVLWLLVVATPFAGGALLLSLGYEVRLATLTLVVLTTIVVTEAAQTFRLHAGMGRAASIFDSDAAPVRDTTSPEERLRDLQLLAGRIAAERVADAESRRVLVHELKTPITSLRGLTQLLDGYDLSSSERQRVNELLRSEAGRLQTMVERLLDLERLHVRDFENDSIPVDLAALATERVELQRGATEHEIDLDVADAAIVRGDGMLLGRAIDNLLTNALKYSPARSPVSVRVFSSDGSAVLEVRDHGPGIPESERDVIFRRFARGSTSRGTEGLGLGLSLVAEAIAWHRGHVRIDTAPSGGALFRVELPLASATGVGA